jgi:hypothetical protein
MKQTPSGRTFQEEEDCRDRVRISPSVASPCRSSGEQSAGFTRAVNGAEKRT